MTDNHPFVTLRLRGLERRPDVYCSGELIACTPGYVVLLAEIPPAWNGVARERPTRINRNRIKYTSHELPKELAPTAEYEAIVREIAEGGKS